MATAAAALRFRLPGQSQSAGSEVWRAFTQSVQTDLSDHRLNVLREAVPALAGRRQKDYSCGVITFSFKQCSLTAEIHDMGNTRMCKTSANRASSLVLNLGKTLNSGKGSEEMNV